MSRYILPFLIVGLMIDPSWAFSGSPMPKLPALRSSGYRNQALANLMPVAFPLNEIHSAGVLWHGWIGSPLLVGILAAGVLHGAGVPLPHLPGAIWGLGVMATALTLVGMLHQPPQTERDRLLAWLEKNKRKLGIIVPPEVRSPDWLPELVDLLLSGDFPWDQNKEFKKQIQRIFELRVLGHPLIVPEDGEIAHQSENTIRDRKSRMIGAIVRWVQAMRTGRPMVVASARAVGRPSLKPRNKPLVWRAMSGGTMLSAIADEIKLSQKDVEVLGAAGIHTVANLIARIQKNTLPDTWLRESSGLMKIHRILRHRPGFIALAAAAGTSAMAGISLYDLEGDFKLPSRAVTALAKSLNPTLFTIEQLIDYMATHDPHFRHGLGDTLIAQTMEKLEKFQTHLREISGGSAPIIHERGLRNKEGTAA